MKEKQITYTQINGINYPNLVVPEQTDYPIGKYGQMRLDFLQKHRRGTYTSLLVAFKLNAHLADVDKEARSMVENLTAELAKQQGIYENLKETNQLRWVQEMNNCKASAEEVVRQEVIYRD